MTKVMDPQIRHAQGFPDVLPRSLDARYRFSNEKWAQKMGIKELFEWLKRKPAAKAQEG